MLNRRIPFYSAVISLVSGAVITFFVLDKAHTTAKTEPAADRPVTDARPSASTAVSRQKGYELIGPLLAVSSSVESESLSGLKAKLQNLIEDDKRQGLLSSASVYLCAFAQGDWIYVNPDEMYHPGSMMKVPILLTYLKEAETDPQVMNKKLFYPKPAHIPVQTFNSKVLESNKSYSVKELLQYMIAYSDNNATHLLNESADLNVLRKVFTDLNLAEPNLQDMNYQISARNFSQFLAVLYNASYVSRPSSQYGMELLTESDFKEGMVKELPATVKVAHKFGEWGDARMNIHEFHESGVVYLAGKPYLVTIMTKGNTSKELSVELSKISRVVYEYLSAQSAS